MTASNTESPRVAFDITQDGAALGRIVLELDADQTPATAQNFLEYVDSGFFAGTVFHRVIPNFMIQGGGYGPDFTAKRTGVRSPVRNEAASGRSNERGTVAMARTSDPHSATCEFFINVADNDFLNHPGQDGWGYCAFGKVVEGMDIVDQIRKTETTFNPAMGEDSQPKNAPVIANCERL